MAHLTDLLSGMQHFNPIGMRKGPCHHQAHKASTRAPPSSARSTSLWIYCLSARALRTVWGQWHGAHNLSLGFNADSAAFTQQASRNAIESEDPAGGLRLMTAFSGLAYRLCCRS